MMWFKVYCKENRITASAEINNQIFKLYRQTGVSKTLNVLQQDPILYLVFHFLLYLLITLYLNYTKTIKSLSILKAKYVLSNKNFKEPKKILGSSLRAKKEFNWIALKDIKNFK